MVRVDTGGGNTLIVSSAADFAPEVVALRLPSTRVVAVREVDLLGMVAAGGGDVPDFISKKVHDSLTGKRNDGIVVEQHNVGEMLKFVDIVVLAGVVEPVMVRDGANRDGGQINLSDLTSADRLYVFNVVMPAEGETAKSFRDRVEAANVAIVSGGADDGNATQ